MHPITVGQLFCAHLVKVQAKTEQKKIHNRCMQQILGKKGITSRERIFSEAPSLWWKKTEISECEIVKCDTTYPVLRDTLDSPAESVPLNRMSCILHLKYTKIFRTEISLSPSNNIRPEILVTMRLVAHAVTWGMLRASLTMQVETPCCQWRKFHTWHCIWLQYGI